MSSRLLAYLEKEVFFPILTATPDNCPLRQTHLAAVQEDVIDVLRTYYYPCTTAEALKHSVALTTVAPRFTGLWSTLARLGLPTPLDPSVQNTFHALAS